MRDTALFITILCACSVIGYPFCLLFPAKGIRARALCAPPIGYGALAVSSNVLYSWNMPTSTSLAVISGIGLLATSAILLTRHGLPLAFRVPTFGAHEITAPLVVAIVALLCLMPAWTGGTVFKIFQGNVYDQFTYLAASVSFHHFNYAFLNMPDAQRDVITNIARWLLVRRPSPPIVYSAFANIWHSNSLSGAYSYLAALQTNMMFAALFLFFNVFNFGRWLALLLSAALTLGFFQQYVLDLNSWGELASQPIFLIMTTICVFAMKPEQIDASPRGALLRIGALFGIMLSSTLYIYPESLAVYGPAGLAPAIIALIAARHGQWRPVALGIAALVLGVAVALLVGLLYFEGTINFLYSQFTGLAISNVDWWRYFQLYLFGRDTDYLAILTGRQQASWSIFFDALFSLPVEATAAAAGLYYILPTSCPTIIAVAYKMLLYFFIAGLFIGSARATARYWRLHPASNQVRMMGACLVGLTIPIIIFSAGQYWSAGKALSMAAPLLFVLLVTPLLFLSCSDYLARVCSIIFVLGHLGLGIARPVVSSDPTGGSILGLPGAATKAQKANYDWRHDQWGALIQSCTRIAIDVDHEFLGRLVEIVATDREVPWSSLQSGYANKPRRPIRQEFFDQADCLVTDHRRPDDSKKLIWVADSIIPDYLTGKIRSLEIGVSPPTGIKATGLHGLEAPQRGSALRWTSADAHIEAPNNPAAPATRLALELWDISLDTSARLVVTVNGHSLYDDKIPNNPVELPLERFAADRTLRIQLQVIPVRRAPGDGARTGRADQAFATNKVSFRCRCYQCPGPPAALLFKRSGQEIQSARPQSNIVDR
jgi:hypothetical protein